MASRFHAHLGVCKHCRENPFDLCMVGRVLLSAEARNPKEEKKDG